MVSLLGLYFSENLRVSYIFIFILGLSFPGKSVIWYNYQLEITKEKYKQFTVNLIIIWETMAIILIAFFY